MALTAEQCTFETTECGRCGGSGRYSYCQAHGDKCFGCQGTGRALTVRGKKAQKFYDDLLSPAVTEIEAGDKVKFSRFGGFEEVLESRVGEGGLWMIRTAWSTSNVFPSTRVRKAWSNDQKAEFKERAKAYQASLNKRGK